MATEWPAIALMTMAQSVVADARLRTDADREQSRRKLLHQKRYALAIEGENAGQGGFPFRTVLAKSSPAGSSEIEAGR